MDLSLLKRRTELEWVIEPRGKMRVPGVLFAIEPLERTMDHKALEQVMNVAHLPASSTPRCDARRALGLRLRGRGAWPPSTPTKASSPGRRRVRHLLRRAVPAPAAHPGRGRARNVLADALFREVPGGVGGRGRIRIWGEDMDRVLRDGARWAVEEGWGGGRPRALRGRRGDGDADRRRSPTVPGRACGEVGTLGSGNHYLEVQEVEEVHDAEAAEAFGLRGATSSSRSTAARGARPPDRHRGAARDLDASRKHGIDLPDRELACAPSARRRASTTSARCAPPSTWPSPTGRSSRTSRGRRRLRPAAVGPHPPLRRLAQHLQGRDARGGRKPREVYVHRKGRRGPGGRGTRGFPTACGRSASRCSSAARWARRAGCWPAPRRACGRASAPPATGRAGA